MVFLCVTDLGQLDEPGEMALVLVLDLDSRYSDASTHSRVDFDQVVHWPQSFYLPGA